MNLHVLGSFGFISNILLSTLRNTVICYLARFIKLKTNCLLKINIIINIDKKVKMLKNLNVSYLFLRQVCNFTIHLIRV